MAHENKILRRTSITMKKMERSGIPTFKAVSLWNDRGRSLIETASTEVTLHPPSMGVRIISPWAISRACIGGLIIRTELIYEYTIYKHLYLYKNFELKMGGLIIHHGLIIRTIQYVQNVFQKMLIIRFGAFQAIIWGCNKCPF